MSAASALQKRLARIWESPDFSSFFEQYSKKPAHFVKKGTVLFNSGDPLSNLYFVKTGFVKLYQLSSEGRETVIYLSGRGNVLGVRALTTQEKCAKHFAETITECYIATLTHQEFYDIATEHPEFLIDIMHVFINRLNHAESRLEGFLTTDVKTRVANFVYDCALRFGDKKENTVSIPLQLTHQRIAEFVGSFRETVTHAVQKLEKEGYLIDKRGIITILDMEKLGKTARPAYNF